MWGSLKGGGVYGMKVVAIGGTWAALEELSSQVQPVNSVREVVAGTGGAAIFSAFGLCSKRVYALRMTEL
jgi:hypothetical protein